jgi:hypothetical protein
LVPIELLWIELHEAVEVADNPIRYVDSSSAVLTIDCGKTGLRGKR